MASLFQVVYTSTAAHDFGRSELLELLKGSVERNAQVGVTGMLLYKDGCFMEALEGEEKEVIPLFAKISHDPRHHHVVPLIHEPIKQRSFSDSAMAFPAWDAPELQDMPGYSEFLNTPLNGELLAKNLPKCQRLLLQFKQDLR